MIISQQPNKQVIYNEVCIMKEIHHKNIVNFIDSYIKEGTLWVKEFMLKKNYLYSLGCYGICRWYFISRGN